MACCLDDAEDGSISDHADSKSAQPGATPGFSATLFAALPAGWKRRFVIRCHWTVPQLERLKALGAGVQALERAFDTETQRNAVFQEQVKSLTREGRDKLARLRDDGCRPLLAQMEDQLAEQLIGQAFTQVATPIIMSRGHLERMTIGPDHKLYRQVFWLDDNRCLRPMLAPHLYYVSRDLLRLWPRPLRLFEIGPCFRKESQGARHTNEFTMLNIVEYGMAMEERTQRLVELADQVMSAAGIEDYTTRTVHSDVYGETTDVVVGPEDIEVASAAIGPHRLDEAWGVSEAWVGIGFGLERLIMVSHSLDGLKKCGRSLSYLNGIPLNI